MTYQGRTQFPNRNLGNHGEWGRRGGVKITLVNYCLAKYLKHYLENIGKSSFDPILSCFLSFNTMDDKLLYNFDAKFNSQFVISHVKL